MSALSTRRRPVAGVTARLIALVLLPVTVLCLFASTAVMAHWSTATRAATVDESVGELALLVELRDALREQQSVAAFAVRFLELGVTPDQATTFIGVDWTSQIAPARAQGDNAIRQLGDRTPVTAAAMQALYTDIDAGAVTSAAAVQRLDGFGQAVDDAETRGLDRLEVDARQTTLIAPLKSLREASGALDAATPRVVDLSAIWFPSPSDTAQSTGAALARLGAGNADYQHRIESLRVLGVRSIVTELERIEADPQVQLFYRAVEAAVRGEPLTAPGDAPDLEKVAATFRGHFVLDEFLASLVATAAVAVRDEARLLAASERTDFVTWAAGAAALALLSIVIALRLARSISTPLKDLASFAHAVNEGNLDIGPSRARNHGPRETRVAFSVFTDLVSNLQLLDAKANALAHLDFDNAALREPLPGRLGRSLESSVALLSGSIVERDHLQIHLAHQATHDSLTGILNRPAAITGIQAAMNRAARTGATTGVLFVDLNEFKAVNDSHGHEVGDEVLRQIASRVSVGMRSGDFVARLGGDEFVVVAEAIAGVAEATELARRIVETVTQPIEIGSLSVSVGAAIGVALTLDGPEDPSRLLARADAAMYRAKQHDGSNIEIFDADLQRQMIQREDIETALTAALADPTNDELELHYQPVLHIASGKMVAAEALIRWDRPGHGLMQPDEFIPVAEATALIIEIDRWVLAEAARQLVVWSTVADLAGLEVAVNISGRHLLSRQLPQHIRNVLEESGIDPHRLTIEITETVLLTDLVAAAAELDEVRALGVRVAIDDFGTGYTSLAALQQLPIDTIKIDRSFISRLDLRKGTSLVRMVTDLGHAIDITIVAEGVETNDERNALQAMGADYIQGFLLSKPLPPPAFEEWAHLNARARADAFVR
ncbi:MAG TPA: EAL domain-containing protein [Acidimicrobiales bacterium]|nr:EAL domain-containing protein [Acidimicrobiales bacterium]